MQRGVLHLLDSSLRGMEDAELWWSQKSMPYRILCNGVKREGVKVSPDLAFGLFSYLPLHKIRDGIKKPTIG